MSISPAYLLNVALHAAILSIAAGFTVALTRRVATRSLAATVGLLAVGLLPWVTALRPVKIEKDSPAAVETTVPVLPVWTVVKMKAPAVETTVVTPAPAPATAEAPVAPPATPVAEPFRWPDLPRTLVFIWAAGLVATLLPMAAAWLRLRAWRRRLVPVDDDGWRKIAPFAEGTAGRRAFLIDPEKASPCVAGLWNPRIVLPSFLLEENEARRLGWAVRHELGHWQAGDSRRMVLFSLIKKVNWWNPMVARLLARWEEAREQACDLRAAGTTEQRADYGDFLIAMARGVSRRTPFTVAMARRGNSKLGRRIRFLLGAMAGAEKPAGKWPAGLVCAWFVATAVMISGVRIRAEEPVAEILAAAAPAEMKLEEAPTTGTEQPGPRVEISTEYILSSAKPGEKTVAGASLADEEAAAWMKTLKEDRGATSGGLQEFTVTDGRPKDAGYYWPVEGRAARDLPQTPFLGVKLKLTPEIKPGEVAIKLSSDYRHIPGIPEPIGLILAAREDLPPGLDPASVEIQKKETTLNLRPGQTFCSELGRDEKGRTLWLFTKVKTTDPAEAMRSAPASPPAGLSPQIVAISTKFTVTDQPLGLPEQPVSPDGRFSLSSIFTEGQVQMIMRDLSQQGGTILKTVPSISVRSREQGIIELIREVRGTTAPAAGEPLPFTGISSRVTADLGDETIRPAPSGDTVVLPTERDSVELDYRVDYRFVPGIHQPIMEPGAAIPQGVDPGQIRILRKEIKGEVFSGMTVAMGLGEIERGKYLTIFIQVDVTDATGRPIRPKLSGGVEFTGSTPSPETKGKMRLSGTIVDIPRISGPVSGSTPIHPALAKAMLGIPGAKIRKLKPVEIPLFQRGIPWPEIQDFKVSAIVSEDFTQMSMARWTLKGAGEFPEPWLDLAAGSIMNVSLGTPSPTIDRRLLLEITPVK